MGFGESKPLLPPGVRLANAKCPDCNFQNSECQCILGEQSIALPHGIPVPKELTDALLASANNISTVTPLSSLTDGRLNPLSSNKSTSTVTMKPGSAACAATTTAAIQVKTSGSLLMRAAPVKTYGPLLVPDVECSICYQYSRDCFCPGIVGQREAALREKMTIGDQIREMDLLLGDLVGQNLGEHKNRVEKQVDDILDRGTDILAQNRLLAEHFGSGTLDEAIMTTHIALVKEWLDDSRKTADEICRMFMRAPKSEAVEHVQQ